MVKTQQVGDPKDFVHHPLIEKYLSAHSTQEGLALGAIRLYD